MFVAQENGSSGRRKFQKPNILRRRSKPPTKQNSSVSCESPGVKALVTSTSEPKLQLNELINGPSGTVVSGIVKRTSCHVVFSSTSVFYNKYGVWVFGICLKLLIFFSVCFLNCIFVIEYMYTYNLC